MRIYYFQLLLLVVSLFISKLTKNPRKSICIFAFFILIVVIGLRDPIGGYNGDNFRYYNEYYKLGTSKIVSCFTRRRGQNILFYFLQWLLAHIGIKYEVFNFLISLFAIGTTCKMIYKYSDKPLLSIFLYMGLLVYPLSFYLVKQSISIPITLLAFDQCCENRKSRAIILCLIATLIHDSAIIFLLIVFSDKLIKILKKNILLISFTGVLIFIFKYQIGQIIMQIFKEEYIGEYNSKSQIGGLAIILISMLILYTYSIDINLIYKIYTTKNASLMNFEYLLLFAGVICVFVQILASYAYAYTRLNLYFIQLFMFITPHSLVQRKLKHLFSKSYDIVYFLIYFALIVLMSWLYFGSLRDYDSEYRFFWQSKVWNLG